MRPVMQQRAYVSSSLALAVLGLVLCTAVSEATTYYAAPSGGASCGAAQSRSTPIQGLNAGAACLSGGDTLIIRNGTYPEYLGDVIPAGLSASQPTTIKAENRRQAILSGIEPGHGVVIRLGIREDPTISQVGVGRPYVTIDGLVFAIPTTVAGGAFSIQGASSGPSSPHDIQLLNNEIYGGYNSGSLSFFSTGIGFGGSGNHITVRNNYIHDIGMVGAVPGMAAYSYGMYISGPDNLIENNEIARTSGYAFHGYSGTGLFNNNIFRNNYIHDTGGPVLLACGGSNNQIYNNIIVRTGIGPAPQRGGIVLGTTCAGSPSNSNQVYNNTVVGTVGSGASEACITLSLATLVSASNNIVKNNLCSGNSPDDSIRNTSSGAATNTIDHNFCASGTATCGTNALSGTPQFVGSALTVKEDFQLQATSPALNAGVCLSQVPTDMGGTARPQGSTCNIGAWEGSGGGAIR